MASQDIDQRRGFGDLLAELSDSDVVIEVVASAGVRRSPDIDHGQLLREAVAASYRALAGQVPIQVETAAVLEEVTRGSVSLWLRAKAVQSL